MLDIRIDKKTYPAIGGGEECPVFRQFELQAAENEFVCLFGPSGCGKTTLLNIVAGLDEDFEGRIDHPKAVAPGAIRTGYVFQEPRLLPWRSVRDNVRLAVMGDPGRMAKVDDILQLVGLSELANAYPKHLSAGQARRAALARAFASEPDLLLMDEPFVSLDDPAAEVLHQVLLQAWTAQPATILFVTHNLSEAFLLADRVVLLEGQPAAIVADQHIALPREGRPGSSEILAMQSKFDTLRRGQTGPIPAVPGNDPRQSA